jgi:hypothetical protein
LWTRTAGLRAIIRRIPSPTTLPAHLHTAEALLKIAAVFNHDYTGDYGPVYARWDARSQAIITGAGYIARHRDCPGGPEALSRTESVSLGSPHGAWLVHYEVGGQQLTDYWFHVHRRRMFDLVLSNPGAVMLYRMPPSQYAAAVGLRILIRPRQGEQPQVGTAHDGTCRTHRSGATGSLTRGIIATDPVRGTQVNPTAAPARCGTGGITVHLCSWAAPPPATPNPGATPPSPGWWSPAEGRQ